MWHRGENIDVGDTETLIRVICPYLRDLKECERCPVSENDKNHGPYTRGCRLLAEEVINICQTGNPWRRA